MIPRARSPWQAPVIAHHRRRPWAVRDAGRLQAPGVPRPPPL